MKLLDKGKESRHGRRGTAMVEVALTLVLFLTFLFSLFDFGWALFYHHTLVHQARTAARYGAVNPTDTAAIRNMVLYNRTTGSGSGILGLTSSNVAVTRTGTPGASDDHIVVTISGYRFLLITFGWAGQHDGNPIAISMPVEN